MPQVVYAEPPKCDLALNDHLTTFGLYVGNEMRRIPTNYAKQLAKCKINNIIFEATTGQFNPTNEGNDNSNSHFSRVISNSKNEINSQNNSLQNDSHSVKKDADNSDNANIEQENYNQL